ncbi:MAG: hypothetical protein LBV43_03685 [Prevotella sp.]|jgi:gliding motility-associated lipoprotein GldD|nr:hypothetical protein [Prevotella sp.]
MRVIILLTVLCFIFISCNEYTPKPNAYPRIERQESGTDTFIYSNFSFLYPQVAKIERIKNEGDSKFWFNIAYLQYDATIHCTYLKLDRNSLPKMLDEAYHFAYDHASKAESISQIQYSDSLHKNTGILYDISGQVASPVQFYITDNVSNFIRGALYFNREVKMDSVSPVVQYIRQDIIKLMESVQWSN